MAPEETAAAKEREGEYVVVARRYRPQTFTELIGQEHVAQALSGAITTHRVGHAYLFTGARGVGKTSSARILAKALNCEKGPSPAPCNECDICQSISSGDDVDVLEIDGASNRGIDEIRELRQKVNVRPSRARFKIYIIDEVHMLTREAFNALLKTLEEPPEHVKFIFCTTEVEKIPITILSRCQRFDFAGIRPTSIRQRLQQIVETEGVEAEPEALEIIARRAAGSMRDSQSLLEQLLSCCEKKITVADIHRLLGTAGDERLIELVRAVVQRDAKTGLQLIDRACADGVDIGQLMDQLLGYFRDLLVSVVGIEADALMYVASASRDMMRQAADHLGVDAILAAMQIVETALARMRSSTHGRTLAEMAIVRICRLEDLVQLGAIIAQLSDGQPPALTAPAVAVRSLSDSAVKKNVESAPGVNSPAATTSSRPALAPVAETAAPPQSEVVDRAVDPADAAKIWQQAVARMDDMTAQRAGLAESPAICAPNRLVVRYQQQYTFWKRYCEKPEILSSIEQAVQAVCGAKLKVEFELIPDAPGSGSPTTEPQSAAKSARDNFYEKLQEPFVKRAMELFHARPIRPGS